MKPILDKIELGQMEEWNFTASDGTEIKEWFVCRRLLTRTRSIRLSYTIMEERLLQPAV